MKVLHIISSFSHSLNLQFLKSLSKRVSEQFVYYPYRKHAKANHKFLESENIHYYQEKVLNYLTTIFYFYKLFVQYRNINKNVDIKKFDIIHAHTLFSDGGLAYILHKIYHIPYIVAVRSTDTDDFFKYKPWLKLFAKVIIKNADSVVCISPAIKTKSTKILVKKQVKKVIVIPNGIDEVFFAEKTESKQCIKANEIIKLIYVGQFLRSKKIDKIIDFVSLKSNFHLTIIGGGGNADSLIKSKIKLNSNVNYIGIVNDKIKIKNYLRKADIFIMPSVNETFGLVYIEAMSQGTPIIYTKGTGIDGYFDSIPVGYSVDAADVSSWQEKIEAVIRNYSILSKNSVNQSLVFRWSMISNKYVDLYESALLPKQAKNLKNELLTII